MALPLANTSPDRYLTLLRASAAPGSAASPRAGRPRVVVAPGDVHPRRLAPGQAALVAVRLALKPPAPPGGAGGAGGCPASFRLQVEARLGEDPAAETLTVESAPLSVRFPSRREPPRNGGGRACAARRA